MTTRKATANTYPPQFAKYKTQAQVDAAIKGFIEHAVRAEDRRDRATYESAEYWKHHDVAQRWYDKAAMLMPPYPTKSRRR